MRPIGVTIFVFIFAYGIFILANNIHKYSTGPWYQARESTHNLAVLNTRMDLLQELRAVSDCPHIAEYYEKTKYEIDN
jgi:hypothetical protein